MCCLSLHNYQLSFLWLVNEWYIIMLQNFLACPPSEGSICVFCFVLFCVLFFLSASSVFVCPFVHSMKAVTPQVAAIPTLSYGVRCAEVRLHWCCVVVFCSMKVVTPQVDAVATLSSCVRCADVRFHCCYVVVFCAFWI